MWSAENAALFFHLLGAFALIAGSSIAAVAFEAGRRRETPAEIALLLGLSRIGVALVALGTLLAVAFGLWLVDAGDWSYGAGWIDAAIALLVAAVVLGAVGGQTPKRSQAREPARERGRSGERRAARAARRPDGARAQLPLGAAPARDPRADGVQARSVTGPYGRSAPTAARSASVNSSESPKATAP